VNFNLFTLHAAVAAVCTNANGASNKMLTRTTTIIIALELCSSVGMRNSPQRWEKTGYGCEPRTLIKPFDAIITSFDSVQDAADLVEGH